jgi:hypothetical protein
LRALRALRAAATCVGLARQGTQTYGVPAADVLWALPWLGLILGLAWSAVFAVAWRLFGEYPVGLRLVPDLAVVIADLLLTSCFTMAGVRMLESLASRDDSLLNNHRKDITAAGVLAAIVLILVTYATLLAIPKGIEWWPADWRRHLHWMYPRPIFRPLVVMPMWACWSMVLAAGIGRARPEPIGAPNLLDKLAGQATPSHIFLGFLPAALLTAVYASRDKNPAIGFGIALVVFLCVYVAAMAAALRWRGQTGVTILAAGLVGRVAFVLCWLFIGRVLHGW